MEELFYTKENYWVVIENDIATIGVTDFVINNMNIVNYVELPTIGNVCSKTDLLGVINYNDDENFELYSQLSGEIIDVNDSLIDNCEQILGNDIDNNWLYNAPRGLYNNDIKQFLFNCVSKTGRCIYGE